jgi:hypothetical protein
MKIVVLASIVAGAAAFAPAQQASPSTTALADTGPNQAYAGEPGVVAPLGLFDPFSLLDNADKDRFDRLRSVELKHGRVSMLAVVGYLVTEGRWTNVLVILFATPRESML